MKDIPESKKEEMLKALQVVSEATMNVSERIYVKLLEAAANVDNAEAIVLLIGYNDNHAMTNIIGSGANILSMLTTALDHTLRQHPTALERELRMKAAEIILRGKDDAAE